MLPVDCINNCWNPQRRDLEVHKVSPRGRTEPRKKKGPRTGLGVGIGESCRTFDTILFSFLGQYVPMAKPVGPLTHAVLDFNNCLGRHSEAFWEGFQLHCVSLPPFFDPRTNIVVNVQICSSCSAVKCPKDSKLSVMACVVIILFYN